MKIQHKKSTYEEFLKGFAQITFAKNTKIWFQKVVYNFSLNYKTA